MARLERLPTHIRIELEPQDRKLEIGRQTRDEPPPLAVIPSPVMTRLVIATREETLIGRDQLRIEVIDSVRVRLTNINDNNRIFLSADASLGPGETSEVTLPIGLTRGNIQLRIEKAGASNELLEDNAFQSMAAPPQIPNSSLLAANPISAMFDEESSILHSIRHSDANVMLDHLGQLILVLQQAASSTDFVDEIAKTAMRMVNLDRAVVMTLNQGNWKIVGCVGQQRNNSDEWRPSQKLLSQLVRDQRTLWGAPTAFSSDFSESIASVVSVVAAPILNPVGQVIGAVYGDRRIGSGSARPPINQLDAKLVEIMACGVAGGWARMEQERSAAARRIQFERFVTKEVAQELEVDPNALAGRDADVTMLFCDIAGFSRISEQMSPQKTFEWINLVMEVLSQCVLATKGTLVDYIGDELIAMWGAPLSTPDHATNAASTAIMMLDSLKKFNDRYPLPGGELTQIGIGLNSGRVRVGNTGSEHKLKYGPLGSQVNIASRVQGATRYLRTPVLITGATAQQLKGDFITRRLCSVRLKNIDEPVELYELTNNQGPTWDHVVQNYELALKAWEQRKLQTAIENLSHVIAKVSHDGPTMVLLSRAVDVWSRDQRDYDPVWTLPSK
jgi:adenylate cyclase